MSIELRSLTKKYGQLAAVDNVNLSLQDGGITVIVGKSGCGKTTLLRLLAGLTPLDGGSVEWGGRSPRVGIVFQEPRLMPWLNVRDNITFARYGAEEKQRAAEELLSDLGLNEFADAYPHELSGGMAQRTALGRTLYQDPELLLLDEPFSALDFFTRRGLQRMLVELWAKHRKTVVLVTHDIGEALLVGQRVLVMENGRIIGDLEVPMEYPRDPADVRFQGLRKEIIKIIGGI